MMFTAYKRHQKSRHTDQNHLGSESAQTTTRGTLLFSLFTEFHFASYTTRGSYKTYNIYFCFSILGRYQLIILLPYIQHSYELSFYQNWS